MDILEEKVEELLQKEDLLADGMKILVCVSGGADSVCLLTVLCALAEKHSLRLAIGHVHHGLRAAADDDEAFVRQLAAARSIPCYAEHVDVPALRKKWKCSVEEAARRARYGALAGIARRIGADRLAVAHHMEDQAETVLLNLFRGAGLRGMAGMEAKKSPEKMDNGDVLQTVIRPLLGISRREIETYLERQGLDHIEDESNKEERYARNCVRHRILPAVRERINAGAPEHIAQTAAYVREALSFIEEEAEERARRLKLDDRTLDVRLLMKETPFMQKQILLAALAEAGALRGITAAHIEALRGLAGGLAGTQRIDLPGGFYAERAYERFRIWRDDPAAGQQAQEILVAMPADGERQYIVLPGAGTVEVTVLHVREAAAKNEIPRNPYTKWFDCDKIEQSVVFRRRRPGDSIDVGTGRKPLAREMLDQKIPASERGGYWLLAQGKEILWIVGNRRSQSCLVEQTTRRILQCVWNRE